MDSLMILTIVIVTLVFTACVLRIWILTAELGRERKSSLTKSAFIRNLSNEIRTPLLSMGHQADILSKEDIFLSKDEKKIISGQMKYNLNLISTLLDEMTGYANGSNSHQAKEERFSPTLMCQRCMTTNLHNTYLNPDVQLRFNRELSDATFVRSDMHMVEFILNKLVINACKLTRQGEILIGCNTTETPDCLTIYVQDTGTGIPEEHIATMFDWFDNPKKADNEIDFDLSVAQKIALKLGGTLRLDDRYLHGTRMLLLLPMR